MENLQTNELVADKIIKIDISNTDIKKLMTSILKCVVHAGMGSPSGIVNSIADIINDITFEKDIQKLVYKLYTKSMSVAIQDVADRLYDILAYDAEQQFDAACAFADINTDISFTFNKLTIESPCKTDYYLIIESSLLIALNNVGLEKKNINLVKRGLQRSFMSALQNEWRNTHEYDELKEYFNTPFDKSVEEGESWSKYRDKLEQNMSEGIFGKEYSLKDIYVRLNAYYDDITEFNKGKSVTIICDIDQNLGRWIQKNDKNDIYRVLSGGPGSGKSTIAKKIALDYCDGCRTIYTFG